jgi:hypothetical protein
MQIISVSPNGQWTIWENANNGDLMLRNEDTNGKFPFYAAYTGRHWTTRWLKDSNHFYMGAQTKQGSHIVLMQATSQGPQKIVQSTFNGVLSYLPHKFAVSPNSRMVAVGVNGYFSRSWRDALIVLGPFERGKVVSKVVLPLDSDPKSWSWIGNEKVLVWTDLKPTSRGKQQTKQAFYLFNIKDTQVTKTRIPLNPTGRIGNLAPQSNGGGEVLGIMHLPKHDELVLIQISERKIENINDLGPNPNLFLGWTFDYSGDKWGVLWTPTAYQGTFNFRIINRQSSRLSPVNQITHSSFPAIDGQGNVWFGDTLRYFPRPKF